MRQQRIGFRMIVVTGGALLMLLPAFIAGWIYTGKLQQEAESLVASGLRARGELGTEQIARRLYSLWQTVDRFARSEDLKAPQDMHRDVTLLASLDDRLSWLGVADVSGKVIAASEGTLEGEDVSQRLWFRRGLAGPFAGDVHEPALLAKPRGPDNEPLRFIDFAAPTHGLDGSVAGVVGIHVNWDWVTNQLASLAGPGVEILLLSRDRQVLFGPADLVGNHLGIGGAVAAGQAKAFVRAERWPDGKDYMTAVIPSVQYRDLPNFGWSVIVRQDIQAALAPTRDLVRSFWTILSSAALVSLGLLYVGAGWLATPLRRLVEFGTRLSAGTADAPPYEESRYREAALLSAVLVRLQSQLRMLPSTIVPAAALPAGGRREQAISSTHGASSSKRNAGFKSAA
jgi:HAMP domain-containing protein